MKKLVILIIVIVGGYLGVKWVLENVSTKSTEDEAKVRVENMMRAMASDDEQTALSLWAEGVTVIDQDAMNAYYDRFREFQRRTGITGTTVWKVTDSKLSAPDSTTAIVTVSNGSSTRVLKVPRRSPIEYVSSG